MDLITLLEGYPVLGITKSYPMDVSHRLSRSISGIRKKKKTRVLTQRKGSKGLKPNRYSGSRSVALHPSSLNKVKFRTSYVEGRPHGDTGKGKD